MSELVRSIKIQALRDKWKNKHISFGTHCQISFDSIFEGYNRIGNDAFIGEQCHIVADIGRFTCIAPRVVQRIVQSLLNTKWWDHPMEWLQENADAFSCVDELLNRMKSVSNDKEGV